MKCDECNNANICLDHIEFPSLGGCTSGMPDRKVITNADRIRNMSDEELAEFIHKMEVTCFADIIGYANKDCGQGEISCRECRAKAPTILEWLQSEVKVEESEEK